MSGLQPPCLQHALSHQLHQQAWHDTATPLPYSPSDRAATSCHQQTCALDAIKHSDRYMPVVLCLENKHASITPRADASSPNSLAMQGLPALCDSTGLPNRSCNHRVVVTTTLIYCAAKHQQLGGGDTAQHMLPHELAATGSPLRCTCLMPVSL